MDLQAFLAARELAALKLSEKLDSLSLIHESEDEEDIYGDSLPEPVVTVAELDEELDDIQRNIQNIMGDYVDMMDCDSCDSFDEACSTDNIDIFSELPDIVGDDEYISGDSSPEPVVTIGELNEELQSIHYEILRYHQHRHNINKSHERRRERVMALYY